MSYRRFSRRAFGATAAATAVTLALPARGSLPKPEIPRLQLALGNDGPLAQLPLTLAAGLGFFEAAGLQVQWSEPLESAQLQQAVASGALAVGVGQFEQVLGLQAQGQFCRAFVLLARSPQVALGLARKHLAWYRTVADLKRCVIGLPALNSASALVARLVLLRAGLGAEDVTLLRLEPLADVAAMLRHGQLDAVSHTDPLMTALEQRSEIALLADTRHLKGCTDLFGALLPATCLYASEAFVRKHPQTVQALTDAVVRALKWLQTAGPGDILKAVPASQMAGDRALFLAALERSRESMSPDGQVPDIGPRTLKRALWTLGDLREPERLELAQCYTNDFARRAKEKFHA